MKCATRIALFHPEGLKTQPLTGSADVPVRTEREARPRLRILTSDPTRSRGSFRLPHVIDQVCSFTRRPPSRELKISTSDSQLPTWDLNIPTRYFQIPVSDLRFPHRESQVPQGKPQVPGQEVAHTFEGVTTPCLGIATPFEGIESPQSRFATPGIPLSFN
jgi:hypothetical protein